MNNTTLDRQSTTSPLNNLDDRAVPRWCIRSIACALLCEDSWHDVDVIDISLEGIKVYWHWDSAHPVTAVRLTDNGPSVTSDYLIIQANFVWEDQPNDLTALRFALPNETETTSLLKFLSSHIAAAPSR